eukprot:1181164-Rhodomonas_salina.2
MSARYASLLSISQLPPQTHYYVSARVYAPGSRVSGVGVEYWRVSGLTNLKATPRTESEGFRHGRYACKIHTTSRMSRSVLIVFSARRQRHFKLYRGEKRGACDPFLRD